MRRLKHKHTRRTVKFYKIVHGFREPFKVCRDVDFDGQACKCAEVVNWKSSQVESSKVNVLQVLIDGNFVKAVQESRCLP